MILKPSDLAQPDRYKLMIGTIVPRPIAWVSTMDESGTLNLAPFSYFTVGSTEPMTLLFCPQVTAEGSEKDTLRNIEQLPEFVINLTDEATAEQMNLTATALPRGHSEFEWAGVTPAASETIRVPRVAEAPVAFECRLQRLVSISDNPWGGTVVFGEVQRIHIRDDIYVNGYVLLDQLKPIGRLAGSGYAYLHDTFSMARVPPPAAEDPDNRPT